LTYIEAHGNPRYIRELKVRLPTKREYGLVNPRRELTFTIKPYDVNSGLIQALPPSENAPGLSVKCAFCDKEMTNLLNINEGLSCFMCTKIKAPRFCLEALARAAYDWWLLDYSYEEYLQQKERRDRGMHAAAEFMEKWIESMGNVKPPKIIVDMAIIDNRIVYLVKKEDAP